MLFSSIFSLVNPLGSWVGYMGKNNIKCTLKDEGDGVVRETCIERENPIHITTLIWRNERPVEYYTFNRLTRTLSYFTHCKVENVFNLKCTEIRILYDHEFEFERSLDVETLDLKKEIMKYVGGICGEKAER